MIQDVIRRIHRLGWPEVIQSTAAVRLVGFVVVSVLAQSAAGQAAEKPPVACSGSLQTGLAETFQLTLGGRFGAGPAWQNRLQVNVDHVGRAGDRLTFHAWNTHDLPSQANDWVAGFRYRPGQWRHAASHSQVSVGFGVERWRFQSVLRGTQDWVAATDVAWSSRAPLSPWATTEYWYNFHSNVPRGQLLYTQAGVQHRLVRRDNFTLTLRQGVAYTQAWGLYDKHGPRVVRYVAALVANFSKCSVEAGLRPQQALQPGIPRNTFWTFSFTQRFGR